MQSSGLTGAAAGCRKGFIEFEVAKIEFAPGLAS